ncbi:MAG: hypothetical protein CBD38_01025 [bacterium TMED178]|nr:MAG: hypothetical protein CBD38_01025 [bacterium TMED178]
MPVTVALSDISSISYIFFYLSILAIMLTAVSFLQFFIAKRGTDVIYFGAGAAYFVSFFAGMSTLCQTRETFFVYYYVFSILFFICMFSIVVVISAGCLLPGTTKITYEKDRNLETHGTNFYVNGDFADLANEAPFGTYVTNDIFTNGTTNIVSISEGPGFYFYTQKTSDSELKPKLQFTVNAAGVSPKVIATVPYESNIQWTSDSTKSCRLIGKRFNNIAGLPLSKDGIYLFCLSQTEDVEMEPENCGFCLFFQNKIIHHWSLHPTMETKQNMLKYKNDTKIDKATLWKMTCHA